MPVYKPDEEFVEQSFEGPLPAFLAAFSKRKKYIWVIVIAVIVCIIAVICLVTNPMHRDTMLMDAEYRVAETLYCLTESYVYEDDDSASICITADYCLWERNEDGEWAFIGQLEPYTLDLAELEQYTGWEDGWRRRYRTGEITDSYILHIPEHEYEGWMYIVFCTDDGDTLLGYGLEDISERGDAYSDDSGFMWLYRLESTLGNRCHVWQHFNDAHGERTDYSNVSLLIDLDKPEVAIDTGNIVHIPYSEEMSEIRQLTELMHTADFKNAVHYNSHWDVAYEEDLCQMLTIGTDDDTTHITHIFMTFGTDSGKCVFSRITTDKLTGEKTETLCFAFENAEIYDQIEKAVEQAVTFAS
ncbi:MAG: hypothetical protein IJX14_07925 [Clostridia bacterium]|nr:hypothetical protein [Clostridia bacterium]